MTEPVGQGLSLTAPLYIRILSVMIAVAGYGLLIAFIPPNALALSLFLWTWLQLRGLFYSPSITIYDNGIETNRFGVRYFTPWKRIEYVMAGNSLMQIAPRPINPAVKILLYNYLMVMSWRTNYDEALKILEKKVKNFRKNEKKQQEQATGKR